MQLPSEPRKGYLISEWGRQLVRYLRGERIVAVLGGRLVESPNGKMIIIDAQKPAILASPKCPLTAIIEGNIDDGYTVCVTTGISGDFVPTFDGSPVGTSNKVELVGPEMLFLKITWTPGVEYDDGDTGYYIAGGGTHVSSEFILDYPRPTDTQAEVDFSTGATTDGIYHILWMVQDEGSPPAITASRCGNHQITFCPGSLKILFD